MPSQQTDTTEIYKAASRACTQSGTFALLLSVALFALLPYWFDRPAEIALSNYVTDRLVLANEMAALDDDPIWQIYKSSHPNADAISISQLLDTYVTRTGSSGSLSATPSATPSAANTPKTTLPLSPKGTPASSGFRPPLPPKMLTATLYDAIDEAPVIAQYLEKLNDPQMLSDSMNESNFFEFSIWKWTTKRTELINENAIHSCTDRPIYVNAKTANSGTPFLDKNAQLSCLTLADVRILATFELPTFPNSLSGQIERQVDVRPGTLPTSLPAATIALQLLLFFVIVYFGAYELEAISSPSFPEPGTLFSAFSQSRLTLIMVRLALWIPVIASAFVSAVSQRSIYWLLTLPILVAVSANHVALRRKSYFRMAGRFRA